MNDNTQFAFPPFTLSGTDQSLWRGGEKIFLRSKSFAVLNYLVEHPHRLVSKEELIQTAWAGAKVVDAALRVSIQEIRKALGDDAEHPHFIETVGKRGYRFLAAVSLKLPREHGSGGSNSFVGRADELEQLSHHLELARGSKRQVVFVTGEPGIGKTALIDVFTNHLPKTGEVIVARGQCIEQYGAGEAFLPVLDGLERLCRAQDGRTIDSLRRLAPSWLLSLPALISADERESLAAQCLGMTAERRLREITAFFEELAQSHTVVLALEDLHWLDPSTLALISFLARRREAARLMLIGTYRAGEVKRLNLPLKTVAAELNLHHLCVHLPLKRLTRSAVEEYLAARFENPAVSSQAVSAVYSRSDGNPLFMVNVTDYLVDHQAILLEDNSIKVAANHNQQPVPDTIRDLITRQFEALPEEDRELLETASVAGVKFPVVLVARIVGRAREEVEQRCRELAEREQFLQYAGSRKRPGGTSSALYAFNHALYHNVIYDRVGEAKRRRLHREIGEHLETVFAGASEQVAAELALHFERAGNFQCALHYIVQAAQKATRQSAYQEALDYSTFGLKLLESLPDKRQRTEMELHLQVTISVSLASTRGYAAAEVSEAYHRANLLCQEVKDEALRMQALIGLFTFYLMGGKPHRALDFGKQMILAARSIKDRAYLADGHTCTGMALFYLGKYSAAQEHFDQARAAYGSDDGATKTAEQSGYLAYLLTYTAASIWFLGYDAINRWVLGYPVRAEEQMSQAPFLTQQLSNPFTLVVSQVMLASYHQCRSEAKETLKLSEQGIKLASEYGFHHWLTGATMCKGWALTSLGRLEEGMALLREGLKNWRLIGTKTEAMRFISLLAEGCLLSNRTQEGLSLVNEALKLIDETEDRFFQSEVLRIKGELLKQHSTRVGNRVARAEAEAHFLRAIEIARHQNAKSFELRATVSLARLWQKTGKAKEAKKLLAKIYAWFTEGFDTPDLKQARALLDELG